MAFTFDTTYLGLVSDLATTYGNYRTTLINHRSNEIAALFMQGKTTAASIKNQTWIPGAPATPEARKMAIAGVVLTETLENLFELLSSQELQRVLDQEEQDLLFYGFCNRKVATDGPEVLQMTLQMLPVPMTDRQKAIAAFLQLGSMTKF